MTCTYETMTSDELKSEISALSLQLQQYRAMNLSLDMSRGKPSCAQIELSRPLLDVVNSQTPLVDGDAIVDNYGSPDGLPSTRNLVSKLLDVPQKNVIVSGSSSLNLMHDLIVYAFTHGISGQEPFYKQGKITWLCPAPGYDRHFNITEKLGFINKVIPMNDAGPDVAMIRELVEHDPSVKGIWCNPKYSNPTGVTYSDEVVRSLAQLKPAAPDFRIYWDNAYAFHCFKQPDVKLLNIFDALREAHAQNLVYEFGSFAKITFPSSAIAYVCASDEDIATIHDAFMEERVSSEKISQLAHALYFKTPQDVYDHMQKHANIIAPRFALVEEKLSARLGNLGIATWSHPRGGYFVSFDVMHGCAKKIVSCMKELGVTLTTCGATYPYGKDPLDSNIRLAPTYPAFEDLSCALDILCVVTKFVCAQHIQEKKNFVS